jgi:hypothetical protein
MAETTPTPRNEDVLEQLYYGNIHPAEDVPRSEEYWRCSKEYNKLQDEFTASLDDEQRHKYTALCDALHTWQSISDKELYCTGLKYGAKISSALK